ncbi:hypothetical protein HFO91_32660 [Rhizobium leguminosarum]|uniref:hypothetical protein n=1 Tax=Rhizobium leguminosarum TaxID=384 RepID=UPI001C971B56|nr:hypothetical protein [Rhizobium leguminosarum]MBY5454314.1 hypothetical protein [Rhizobium leguminosarum]
MGFEGYVDVVRKLTRRFSLFYAPIYENMKDHGEGALASADVVHPNDAGHHAIFDAFTNADRS